MKIDFGILTILYFAAIVQGIFSAGLLLFSANNRAANRLLGLLILGITGWLVDAFFRVANIYGQNPHLYFLPIYYSFAFGPLLYFYVRSITNSQFKFKKVHLLHFIPVFIQALFYWVVTFQSYNTKYHIWEDLHLPYTYRIEYDGTWLSLVIYLLLSIRLIINYQKWLNNNYADVLPKMLNWLKFGILLMILICIAWLFEAFLRDAKGVYYKYDYSGDLLCIVIFVLGIMSYRQSGINLSFDPQVESLPNSGLNLVADSAIIEKLQVMMREDKLFLNPELTLSDVAKHIQVPAKALSANINIAFGKPFNSYVNTYRVDEIKQRLQTDDLQKFTLLSIAFDCGFNSKTSFNRIFKDFTGLSPSEYLKTSTKS